MAYSERPRRNKLKKAPLPKISLWLLVHFVRICQQRLVLNTKQQTRTTQTRLCKVYMDLQCFWTLNVIEQCLEKCICAYHVIKIHINIMPKINSGPHMRLLHLNARRR